MSDRFDFLEIGDDRPKGPLISPNADPLVESGPGWKPLRLRAIEVIGEPGTEAGQFSSPTGLAVDRDGALYVVDTNNHRVQRIALNGDVKRYGRPGNAPGEMWGPQAVAVDPTGQFFFVAEQGNNRVQCFAFNGQHRGIMNGFRSPSGITFDVQGRLWVADTGNARVMCFDIRSGLCLGALDKKNGVNRPVSVYCDRAGSAYITEGSTGEIVRYASNTRAGTSRVLSSPQQVAIDPQGRVYVAEAGANRLHVFDRQGASLITFDTPSAKFGPFRQPSGIALGPNGEIYVSDTLNHRILRLAWD